VLTEVEPKGTAHVMILCGTHGRETKSESPSEGRCLQGWIQRSRHPPACFACLRNTCVIADEPIPNLPGKRLVSHLVEYPPGGGSTSHRHGKSAFIYAYVISGAIRSQADNEPLRVYKAGEQWFENPGAHHRVSVNASDTEPARLLAVFIADADEEPLTIPDAP
jgi:quercetin dioxygenase-like cupin family protein